MIKVSTTTLSQNNFIPTTTKIGYEAILTHALTIHEQSTTTLLKIIPLTSTLSSNHYSKSTTIMFELIITSTLHQTQHSNHPIHSPNLLKFDSFEIGTIQNYTLNQTQHIIDSYYSNNTITYIFVILIVSLVIILSIILTLVFCKPKQPIPIVNDDIELQVFNTFVTNFVENTTAFQTLENDKNNVNKQLTNDFESIDLNL